MIGFEAYLKLRSIIDELVDRSRMGCIILVEGRRDVLSLRELGVTGKILAVSNTPNAVLVDSIGCRDVVILTDWDKRGERLKDDLVLKLSSWGVVADISFRKRIFAIVGRIVTEVEDLADFVRKVEVDLFGLPKP
jgi:5S rRNA maturation endonuclease (ribonuclease M5)